MWSSRTLTGGVIAALEAGGLTVGDGVAKRFTGSGWEDLTAPFAIVYPISGISEGPAGRGRNDDAVSTVQVTYVGVTREQAEWLRDKGRTALAAGVTVDGRHVFLTDLEDQGVRRNDALPTPEFYAVDRYPLWHTPS